MRIHTVYAHPSMLLHTCNSSTCGEQAGGSGIQMHSDLPVRLSLSDLPVRYLSKPKLNKTNNKQNNIQAKNSIRFWEDKFNFLLFTNEITMHANTPKVFTDHWLGRMRQFNQEVYFIFLFLVVLRIKFKALSPRQPLYQLHPLPLN